MLVNVDVKGLEIVCAAILSGDKTLREELVRGEDIHENNRRDFNLPTRLVSKVFKFRMIFGGGAYSYAHDPEFMHVSTSEKFWQEVIDTYYIKYSGIARWHQEQIKKAQLTGRLEIPSGRYFPFKAEIVYGKVKWPITRIKNFPVQGLGADLVMLARVEAKRLLDLSGIIYKMISTIHDSIVVDCMEQDVATVAKILLQAVESIPRLCKKHWDFDFDLPITAEVQYGRNKRDLVDYRFS